MRKEQIRETDFRMDNRNIRHVPALPEEREDRRRSRRDSGAGERVESVVVGRREKGAAGDQGQRSGNPGIAEGPQRRRRNLESDMVTESLRRRNPEPHINMESQSPGQSYKSHPGLEFPHGSPDGGPSISKGSRRRSRRAGGEEREGGQTRGSYPSQSSSGKIRRAGKKDKISSVISSQDGDAVKKEKKIINLRRGEADGGRGRGGSRRTPFLALALAFVLGVTAGLGGGYYLWGWERPYEVDLKAVEVPGWVTQDFIRKNIFSRPDVSRKRVNNIVVHYVANPGSTAQMNRNYFDNLANQDPESKGASASSHFIVGLEGEVIQCIPITEIAYANAPRNDDTISIEVCHPDDTGKFNDDTYESLVDLTAWLCRELKLSPKDVIRHYDVNEKECPKYFVEHEDAWSQFLGDVKRAME